MVQGLNWNNYSPTQIVEMKNNGIEVPEEVYNKAEAALSEQDAQEVTAQGNDTADVSYTIEDLASGRNEAQEFREELESGGMKLRDMVSMFTMKSSASAADLNTSMKQIEEYVSYVSVQQQQSQELTNAAEDAGQVVLQIAADTENKVQEKSDELAFLNEEIEAGTATEDEVAQAEQLGADIQAISDDSSSQIAAKSAETQAVSDQAAQIDSNLQEIAQNVGKAYNKAIDGQELANETKDMSLKLQEKARKGKIAGAIAGAFFGPLGSAAFSQMFGGKNARIAQHGIMSSAILNGVANHTKDIATTVASQNNISIAAANIAEDAANNATELADATNVDVNVADVPAEATDVPANATDVPADDGSSDNSGSDDDKDKPKK